MRDELIAAMRKHLPPSTAALSLLDVEGAAGAALAQSRSDLKITIMTGAAVDWQLAPDSFDAVAAVDFDVTPDFLAASLSALRPGGRLIVALSDAPISADRVECLEQAGFTRILVEAALDDGRGLLLRGEKPHTERRTAERIQQVAGRDSAESLDSFSGRYLYLLVRQTPNKPVWALRPGEPITWRVVSITGDSPALLAFSSLPKAVAFMQPAVLRSLITDVNKVAKFRREIAGTWPLPVWFNPAVDALGGLSIAYLPIDPASAEAPDE